MEVGQVVDSKKAAPIHWEASEGHAFSVVKPIAQASMKVGVGPGVEWVGRNGDAIRFGGKRCFYGCELEEGCPLGMPWRW